MWSDEALPRLAARGVGVETEVRTLRLTGIGESQVAEQLGDTLLRGRNPEVATYARQEAVDVRISAQAAEGRTAMDLADEAEAIVTAELGAFIWARGDVSWAGALAQALEARGWTLATSEAGTGGTLVTLLRGADVVLHAEVDAATDPDADEATDLAHAEHVRVAAGADVGVAVRAVAAGNDTAVHVAVVTPDGRHAERRLAFMRGSLGADRAAIASAAVLLGVLRGPRT
jgi:nicotinamide-nucleotide amidase